MKIAVLSSHTSSLLWFRIDMMKEFMKYGHSVVAVGPEPESSWGREFAVHGVQYKQLRVERNSINPFDDLKTYRDLCEFMRKEKPDKVFAYQAKTVIYGSLAARASGITEVYSLVAGLGSIFRGTGLKNRVIKSIMKIGYRVSCKANKKVFFQNTDDRDEFVELGVVPIEKTFIIDGSGVNLDFFRPHPMPNTPAFLFIGRLIRDKGVMEYLHACAKLKEHLPEARCMLVGPFDSNPSALKPHELQAYVESGAVEYFGEQCDVRPFIRDCSTYVLPSYHEGTPKTVLESMAMGRAIITTDAPGCRETVKHGVNGYLVPIKDVDALLDAMMALATDMETNARMGQASIQIAENKYDVRLVNSAIMSTMDLLK